MQKYKIRRVGEEVSEANLRPVVVGLGLGTPDEIRDEIQHMYDVLLDRAKLPVNYDNVLALMEIGDAYFMRASELKGKILSLEREGKVNGRSRSTDQYHMLRTGEIETFLTACKRTVETGSRRLAAQQLELDKAIRGLSAWGG